MDFLEFFPAPLEKQIFRLMCLAVRGAYGLGTDALSTRSSHPLIRAARLFDIYLDTA
jgi:hypothetical protein